MYTMWGSTSATGTSWSRPSPGTASAWSTSTDRRSTASAAPADPATVAASQVGGADVDETAGVRPRAEAHPVHARRAEAEPTRTVRADHSVRGFVPRAGAVGDHDARPAGTGRHAQPLRREAVPVHHG